MANNLRGRSSRAMKMATTTASTGAVPSSVPETQPVCSSASSSQNQSLYLLEIIQTPSAIPPKPKKATPSLARSASETPPTRVRRGRALLLTPCPRKRAKRSYRPSELGMRAWNAKDANIVPQCMIWTPTTVRSPALNVIRKAYPAPCVHGHGIYPQAIQDGYANLCFTDTLSIGTNELSVRMIQDDGIEVIEKSLRKTPLRRSARASRPSLLPFNDEDEDRDNKDWDKHAIGLYDPAHSLFSLPTAGPLPGSPIPAAGYLSYSPLPAARPDSMTPAPHSLSPAPDTDAGEGSAKKRKRSDDDAGYAEADAEDWGTGEGIAGKEKVVTTAVQVFLMERRFYYYRTLIIGHGPISASLSVDLTHLFSPITGLDLTELLHLPSLGLLTLDCAS
ncbi:hypothetical protein L198_07848 [Cryptococcus wingfieldii CBS 7118]|uniref:Uncharacterized protein n=1 Tax=Cryptococcus wingfieldii CBS 7118 TaxID=1295528 RepID=A0A1E3HXA1_9TREE|nr:hypothetical protein L198_07848 [Cryptococcus wingfieldii CBS 7118]ODN80191.1 hypothetical protein L198_07848 [Cryptococcus wingfieldii CBS 7118]